MDQKSIQYKQISKFLSSYTILQQSEGATVIASQNNTYLIRHIEISSNSGKQKNQELNEIINTLSQHQTFNSKNILSLIDFQIIFNKNKTQSQIIAIYQYGQKSLAKQIQDRKQSQQHFDQDALWGLLYSIASPLAYLEQKNIIYGVIDASRIFLDKNIIAILDPSSTGIDPYEISPNRLYSPELLKQQRCLQEMDMFKSDVYAMGLLMLQCALLKMELYQYDENVINICLSEIKDIYSENFCHLIESLLDPDTECRPSFSQILMGISNLFEISTSELQNLQPLGPDRENQCNQHCPLDQYNEVENIDILETEYIRSQEYNQTAINDFQKAKLRFCSSRDSRLSQSPIEESSQYSETSSLFIQDSMVKSFQKSRRIYKPKQIKDKLVKNDFVFHSERDNLQQNRGDFHRRSKTNWQHQWPSNKQLEYESKRSQANHNSQSNKKSKQNNALNTNFMKQQVYSPLNKQNLFTRPQIMNMIKNDIKKIQQRKKKNGLSVHFSYLPTSEEKKLTNNQNKNQQGSQSLNSLQFKNHLVHQTIIKSQRRC